MIKLLSLFSGIGAFESALRRGGYEYNLVNYCEIDKYASSSYSQIHNVSEDLNLRDVTKVDTAKLPKDLDLITYGFPCVPAGYLIKTQNGYKSIEDVSTNDYVLTHTNTYQKVVKTMNRISDHINHVKGVGCVDLQITDEHPIYVLRNNEFMWIKAKDLSLSDRLVFNKNTKSENSDIPDNVLWLMGRYFADGYKENHALHRVIFCIGKKKTFEFEEKINGFKFVKQHESRSCIEYKLIDSEIEKYFTDFTTGSAEKEIPQWIIDLSKDKLIHFYNGYYSGDGHNRKDREISMFCTVSKKMAYGLQDIVIKLFNVVPSLNIRKDKRSKTFNDSYCFQFSPRPKQQIICEDKVCVQIKNLYREEKQLKVFNFEVENDNSYTVNNVIVHNCQDISIAGRKNGFFDENGNPTRSGLFYNALKIIRDLQPKYAIAENVKNLTGKKFKEEFKSVLDGLTDAGYNNYWQVLNAKDYGIPQNRERVFIVSIRKDIDNGNFRFPPKQQLKCVAKDFLESVVDDKYYLDNDRVRNLIKQITEKFNIKDRELCDATIFEPEVKSVVNCITARYDAGIQTQKSIGVSVIEPMIKTEGSLYENNAKRGRVYSADGLAPCITSTDYKYPSIFVEPEIKRLGNLYDENAGGARAGNVYDFDGLSPALQTAQGGNRQPIIYKEYKLRKLTPRECFRLMGFTDEEFDRIHNISNTQLYKQAGNSIVVNVLIAIFNELFNQNSVFQLE